MAINEELDNYLSAFRVTESVAVDRLLARSKEHIEKLEQDIKVLRWALERARDALTGQTVQETIAMSLIDTAQKITEPANDR